MSTSAAMAALESASQGLLYQSDTDEPFTVFQWQADGELTVEKVLRRLQKPDNTLVEEETLNRFFQSPTLDEAWHGEEERATVQQYRELHKIVQKVLPDAKVFRVGEVQVEVYVIGTTDEGDWVGLKTLSVET